MPYTKQEDRERFTPILEKFGILSNLQLKDIILDIGVAYARHSICVCNPIVLELPEFNIGDMNFMVTCLLHKAVEDRGLEYKNLNALMGVLVRVQEECDDTLKFKKVEPDVVDELKGVYDSIAREFYARIVRPYEDLKIKENGVISALEERLNSLEE
jgi:hypothetical protein